MAVLRAVLGLTPQIWLWEGIRFLDQSTICQDQSMEGPTSSSKGPKGRHKMGNPIRVAPPWPPGHLHEAGSQALSTYHAHRLCSLQGAVGDPVGPNISAIHATRLRAFMDSPIMWEFRRRCPWICIKHGPSLSIWPRKRAMAMPFRQDRTPIKSLEPAKQSSHLKQLGQARVP